MARKWRCDFGQTTTTPGVSVFPTAVSETDGSHSTTLRSQGLSSHMDRFCLTCMIACFESSDNGKYLKNAPSMDGPWQTMGP